MLLTSVYSINAQTKSKLQLLVGRWYWNYHSEIKTYGLLFTDEWECKFFRFDDNNEMKISDIDLYCYLSNEIDTVFDSSKIGKVENGKYIIEGFIHNKKVRNVYEIKFIDESNLKFSKVFSKGDVEFVKKD